MKIIGYLLIAGASIWLFLVTLPFLWWLWIIFIGMALVTIGKSNEKDKNK